MPDFTHTERAAERAAELRHERDAAIRAAHERAVEVERTALDYATVTDVADMFGIVHEAGHAALAVELHHALATLFRAEAAGRRSALLEAATGLCEVMGRIAEVVAVDRVRLAELRGRDMFEEPRQ